jgi:carbonic anhydrase/acetyltransferase-like protein (isoleucine patch superfamily)
LRDLRRCVRLGALVLLSILPSSLKKVLLRALFGHRFGSDVAVGFSILDADRVDLGQGTRIGHFNVVTRVAVFETGRHVLVGNANIVRGGVRVHLGDYSRVMRFNVLNAIPDHDCTTEPQSVLEVGAGTVITSGHRIDFTDRVTLGKNVIIGGRNSSLWTHNRQETAPIGIGDFCYLGSEVRLAPGAKLPDECILGLGSVLTGEIKEPRSLVAGVPAKVVRPLNEKDLARIRRKTRGDMPDDYYERS